jgi:hypothetical protein
LEKMGLLEHTNLTLDEPHAASRNGEANQLSETEGRYIHEAKGKRVSIVGREDPRHPGMEIAPGAAIRPCGDKR